VFHFNNPKIFTTLKTAIIGNRSTENIDTTAQAAQTIAPCNSPKAPFTELNHSSAGLQPAWILPPRACYLAILVIFYRI
jgi:hypothetical protein